AAREGARMAAQGITINSSSQPTLIQVDQGTPNVKLVVWHYLTQAGINVPWDALEVTFTFLTGDTTLTQPYQGAKRQLFRVQVRSPYQYLRWTTLGPINPSSLTSSVVWTCLVDDPFTLNTTLPSW